MAHLPLEYLQTLSQGIGGFGQALAQQKMFEQERQSKRENIFAQYAYSRGIKPGAEIPPEFRDAAKVSKIFKPKQATAKGANIDVDPQGLPITSTPKEITEDIVELYLEVYGDDLDATRAAIKRNGWIIPF